MASQTSLMHTIFETDLLKFQIFIVLHVIVVCERSLYLKHKETLLNRLLHQFFLILHISEKSWLLTEVHFTKLEAMHFTISISYFGVDQWLFINKSDINHHMLINALCSFSKLEFLGWSSIYPYSLLVTIIRININLFF